MNIEELRGCCLAVKGAEEIKAKSPQTNGICKRFNRTVQNEFYAVDFRKKIYTSIQQLQADLDLWMNLYNTQRARSGKFCFGKTPMQTFIQGVAVARKYELNKEDNLQSNDNNTNHSCCTDQKGYVNSQQTSDSFYTLQ